MVVRKQVKVFKTAIWAHYDTNHNKLRIVNNNVFIGGLERTTMQTTLKDQLFTLSSDILTSGQQLTGKLNHQWAGLSQNNLNYVS